MSQRISRRIFLSGAAATAAAAAADTQSTKALPTRVLGRTGVRTSILALGCGSRLAMYKEEDKGIEAINLALDSGITYLDTAQGYSNGQSETWIGKVMKHRRKEAFLATKTHARTADDAFRWCEDSLKRLQTDQLDLMHIHSLQGEDDLAKVEAKGGVLEALYKLRDQKVVRFIGISSHADPVALQKALERHDFDCTQMALNAALQGMRGGKGKMVINPAMKTSFERLALPVAHRKNMGVIAMKVFGQEDLLGGGPGQGGVEKLMSYALSLPVSVASLGMPQLDFIRQNAQLARNFKPLSKQEMKDYSDRMSAVYKLALDRRFARHVDA